MVSRRQFLHSTASLLAGPLLSGCSIAPRDDLFGPPSNVGPVVDIHAHIFNATDVPISGFLRRVIFGIYDKQVFPDGRIVEPGEIGNGENDGPGWLTTAVAEFLCAFMENVMVHNVVTAREELASLSSTRPLTVPFAVAPAPNQGKPVASAIEALFPPAGVVRPTAAPAPTARYRQRPRSPETQRIIDARVVQGKPGFESQMLKEVRNAKGKAPQSLSEPGAAQAVQDAVDSNCGSQHFILRHLCWAQNLRQSRTTLSQTIERIYSTDGAQVRLFTPQLLNYGNFLDDQPLSPVDDQVAVMEKISLLPGNARFHSFAPYCPLGQSLSGGAELKRVLDVVENRGFLGAKIYPPLGYRPIGNAQSGQPYPLESVKLAQQVGISPAQLPAILDQNLDALYKTAVEYQFPILAHALDSQAAGPGYGKRADPALWDQVLGRHKGLKVCLAHFGSFKAAVRKDDTLNLADLQKTWEYRMGALATKHPGLYIDISYFSELLEPGQDGIDKFAVFKEAVRRSLIDFPVLLERFVYGSDWILIGREPYNERHLYGVVKLFKELKGDIAGVDIGRIFRKNALRMLGLDAAGENHKRLTRFYVRNNVSSAWLQALNQT